MKRILLGFAPAFAIFSFVMIVFFDRNQEVGVGVLVLLPLMPLLAWIIGILVLKMNNVSMRVVVILLITMLGFFSLYIFESNCNLQYHSNSFYQGKAQATGDIAYCKMVGYQAGIDECQKEVALNRGDIRLCEGIVSVDVYNFCKQDMGSRQMGLPRVLVK